MLAYYSVPFDIVGKMSIIPASIAPALFPYFSYHGSAGVDAVSDVTSRSLRYLLLLMTPVTAVFVVFANDILTLWLGGDFADHSTAVLQLLAISFFLNAFAYIPYSSVQALGRPELKAILDLVGMPLYALSKWWLTGYMGITGAALAKVVITVVDVSVYSDCLENGHVFDCPICPGADAARNSRRRVSDVGGISRRTRSRHGCGCCGPSDRLLLVLYGCVLDFRR